MRITRILQLQILSLLNKWITYLCNSAWARNPFGIGAIPTEQVYLELAAEVRLQSYPEVEQYEEQMGYAIPANWLHDLALHTQIVRKKSLLCYAHGRILYSALSRYLVDNSTLQSINIIETGTARGFSSLCMARALDDNGRAGKIMTFDVLPHLVPIYWNCIDDLSGKKSREQLLASWNELINKHVVFVQGDVRIMLPLIQVGRINCAFLDGSHTYNDIMFEFSFIKNWQQIGDLIIFDDYTLNQYPGLVAAVDDICANNGYRPTTIFAHSMRGYVIAVKE